MAHIPNPLLQDDSPRRAYNSTEYTQTQSTVTLLSNGVKLTSNLLLGPGIVIEEAPASPGQGQVPYTKLSVSAEIMALAARVTAIEEMLNGAGSITADSIEVRRIIAKGTGNPPDINIADLEIVTKHHALPNTYHQLTKFVGANSGDMTPSPKIGFFAATANPQQTVTVGFNLEDLQDRLENLGLVIEVPP